MKKPKTGFLNKPYCQLINCSNVLYLVVVLNLLESFVIFNDLTQAQTSGFSLAGLQIMQPLMFNSEHLKKIDMKYIWNSSYLNCGCRWKWRMIIAVNFQFEQLERRTEKIRGSTGFKAVTSAIPVSWRSRVQILFKPWFFSDFFFPIAEIGN